MSLYLKVEILAVAIPFLLSFDQKVRFYKMWNTLLPSIFISGALFAVSDILVTKQGIWGFNPRYHSGILLSGLPLEEWLFFILIPYSSLFIHYVFLAYSGNYSLKDKPVRIISGLLLLLLLVMILFNTGRIYTLICCIVLILLIVAGNLDKMRVLNSYLLTFPIILIPFMIVNSILSGTFTEGPVFLYNKSSISGLHLLTVPVEDIGYAFALIFVPLILNEKLRQIFKTNDKNSRP
jgi:lycopene cyclase domain-containing protein